VSNIKIYDRRATQPDGMDRRSNVTVIMNRGTKDLELLRAAANGDQEAFRHLVEAHQNKVLRICFGFVRDLEEAEDVAQEVFFKVYVSAGSFRGRSRVSTWLYRIAVNCCLNHIRKLKSRAWLPWTSQRFDSPDMLEQLPSEQEPADALLERNERRKMLREALNRLPTNQRVAFTLHGVEGFSYEEIARIMNCSHSAVESRIHRAKLNLRKHVTRAIKGRK